MRRLDSHSNTSHYVGRIPEADISGVRATIRLPPRHYKQVYLYDNIEDDNWVPGSEGRSWKADTGPSPADDVQADPHEEGEERRWIYLEVGDYRGKRVVSVQDHMKKTMS